MPTSTVCVLSYSVSTVLYSAQFLRDSAQDQVIPQPPIMVSAARLYVANAHGLGFPLSPTFTSPDVSIAGLPRCRLCHLKSGFLPEWAGQVTVDFAWWATIHPPWWRMPGWSAWLTWVYGSAEKSILNASEFPLPDTWTPCYNSWCLCLSISENAGPCSGMYMMIGASTSWFHARQVEENWLLCQTR